MSRSIHATRNEYGRESRFRYAAGDVRDRRLEIYREQLRKKRCIKEGVRRERGAPPPADLPPAAAEAVPVQVVDEGRYIHYPASPDDHLRAPG